MVDSSRLINSAHHGAPSAPAGGARGVGMRPLGYSYEKLFPRLQNTSRGSAFDSGTGELQHQEIPQNHVRTMGFKERRESVASQFSNFKMHGSSCPCSGCWFTTY